MANGPAKGARAIMIYVVIMGTVAAVLLAFAGVVYTITSDTMAGQSPFPMAAHQPALKGTEDRPGSFHK